MDKSALQGVIEMIVRDVGYYRLINCIESIAQEDKRFLSGVSEVAVSDIRKMRSHLNDAASIAPDRGAYGTD